MCTKLLVSNEPGTYGSGARGQIEDLGISMAGAELGQRGRPQRDQIGKAPLEKCSLNGWCLNTQRQVEG